MSRRICTCLPEHSLLAYIHGRRWGFRPQFSPLSPLATSVMSDLTNKCMWWVPKSYVPTIYWPRHEKTCLRGIQQNKFQTSLLSYTDYLENWNITCSKCINATFRKANNKGADQTARMRRLVCACVVRKPPKTVFSRVETQLLSYFLIILPPGYIWKRLKVLTQKTVRSNCQASLCWTQYSSNTQKKDTDTATRLFYHTGQLDRTVLVSENLVNIEAA